MLMDRVKVKHSVDAKRAELTMGSGRVSSYTDAFKGEYYNIDVNKLVPFHNQARILFDDEGIHKLADTIKGHGIRQPLTIIPSEKVGFYEIVSGERRFRAALLLKYQRVPCIIIKDKQKAEEIAIIENIQRKDLHPVELMRAYLNLLSNKICDSYSEIAKKVGVSKSSVVDILNLRRLDVEVQKALVVNDIKNRDFLRKLCEKEGCDQMIALDLFLQGQDVAKKKQNDLNRFIKLFTVYQDRSNNEVRLVCNASTRDMDTACKEMIIKEFEKII